MTFPWSENIFRNAMTFPGPVQISSTMTFDFWQCEPWFPHDNSYCSPKFELVWPNSLGWKMKQCMFCVCICASILLFVVVIRIFVSILFTFVPRWFFTPVQFSVFWAKCYIYWRMSSLALPVLSNQAHCCIQNASLHPGAQKFQCRCSKTIYVEITKSVNTKEIRFHNHSFFRLLLVILPICYQRWGCKTMQGKILQEYEV